MANTDKNILITPNVGSANDPQIVFSGASATLGPQTITVKAKSDYNGTLSFEGSAGQLFSITNSLTGVVYSINLASGVPVLEALDTGEIKLSQYSGFTNIAGTTDSTSSTTGVLRVAGGVGIVKNLNVGGTITGGVASIASAATITPSITVSQYNVTALAEATTFAVPSAGIDGQQLRLRIKDNGTARALTWTTTSGGYRVVGTTLPTTTSAGKVTYITLVYNSQDVFWDVLSVTTQA